MATKVSVIIPTHERSNLVSRAIESVLKQTYEDFECIVVDDGSTDGTDRVVQGYDDDRIVYLSHESSRGASAARNTGIDYASGQYIAFLDDDDEWEPTKLEKQVDVLENTPKTVGLVYCWMNYHDDADSVIRRHHPTLDGYVFPEVLDRQRIGGCPTLLVRHEVVESVGGFDESLPRGNDGDFIRRISRDNLIAFVPETLVKVDWDHGYERISDSSESGIRSAIRGQQAKLEKFETELEAYPNRAARIYAQIAYHHSQLGELKYSISYYKRAVRTAPSSPQVYRTMLRSAKTVLLE